MKARRWLQAFLLLWMVFAMSRAIAAELREFDADSLAAIRAVHAGKPFVLTFWSVHCDPCRAEMADWKTLRRRYPRIPVVLVAADSLRERAVIEAFLKRYDPGSVERWAFADDFQERIRYSVDRGWRGELPRTYLFDAGHRSDAISGAIRLDAVDAWMKRQPGSAR